MYPLELLQTAVIGRLRIDPLVLKVAREQRLKIVDLSSIPSFHQGFVDSQGKRYNLLFDDYYYNLRFIKFTEEGRLLANYRVYDYYEK